MSRQFRQVSQPVFNPGDGYWYNRVRFIESDGAGGYTVVTDEMHRAQQQFDRTLLPQPWTDSIGSWSAVQLAKTVVDLAIGNLPGALGDIFDYFKMQYDINRAFGEGGDPFSGTIFDVPYSQWSGTDQPWNPSTVQLPGQPAAPASDGPFPNPERPSAVAPDDPAAPFEPNHPNPLHLSDPLVLDLNGNGIELTDVRSSNAHFDYGGTGFAVHTGWFAPTEGILIRDIDHNSSVTADELFGAASANALTSGQHLSVNARGGAERI